LDLSGLTRVQELILAGLPLQEGDLAFLKHLPSLESLMLEPSSSLTGTSLHHLGGLPQLRRLWVLGLSDCTGRDLTSLSNLQRLSDLRIAGDITDAALASLAGPPRLNSLQVETDHPIRRETVTDLAKSHPGMEYIHINTLPPVPIPPVDSPEHRGLSQRRAAPQTPAHRPRRR
jgi:hypothetical protein